MPKAVCYIDICSRNLYFFRVCIRKRYYGRNYNRRYTFSADERYACLLHSENVKAKIARKMSILSVFKS